MLEPLYGPQADATLDRIEADPARTDLWEQIVRTLNMICQEPDSETARRFRIQSPTGRILWRVPIRSGRETQNWTILWEQAGDEDAVIHYVGEWPPPGKEPMS